MSRIIFRFVYILLSFYLIIAGANGLRNSLIPEYEPEPEIKPVIAPTAFKPTTYTNEEQVSIQGILDPLEGEPRIEENFRELWRYEGYIPTSTYAKPYMCGSKVTNITSKQYWYIKDHMFVDMDGYYRDIYGFYGVALGSYWGEIGSRYYVELSTGYILKVVKVDAKRNEDTDETNKWGATAGEFIEFVIDENHPEMLKLMGSNDYILNGSFNNLEEFKGHVISITKVEGV